MEIDKKQYEKYVKEITPTHNIALNVLKAFLVGGLICVIGQGCINLFMAQGMDDKAAASWTLLVLIGSSVLLTGFGIFSGLAKFAGAGVLVPITGFANSVVAPSIEYKKEGQVFGIGCKVFTIAGPVILYGILSSWLLGVIYWVLMLLGVVQA